MVEVARDIAGIAVFDFSRRVREAVPDRFALAVRARRAFDLVGRARCTPEKVLRKRDRCHTRLYPRAGAHGNRRARRSRL